jgi:hypothetical protein
MSIHSVMRKSGAEHFVVRYRDPEGVHRARAFASRADAERYQGEIDAAKARRRERQLAADKDRF